MVGDTYAFIDGGYFRKVCDDYMQQLFAVPAEIDYSRLRYSTQARRTYYYDCLNDIAKDGESQEELNARVNRQRTTFDSIQSTEGFHVRLGSLSGSSRNLRQKKVDVLLAVEALDHAVRKNMERMCLIAGDLDFTPLVDSLVRLGTYVEVIYQPRSAARGLYSAADVGHPLSLAEVHGWMSNEFQNQHPIPHCVSGVLPPVPHGHPLKVGSARGYRVEQWRIGERFFLYLPTWDFGYSLQAEFTDPDLLERYFALAYAPLEWA